MGRDGDELRFNNRVVKVGRDGVEWILDVSWMFESIFKELNILVKLLLPSLLLQGGLGHLLLLLVLLLHLVQHLVLNKYSSEGRTGGRGLQNRREEREQKKCKIHDIHILRGFKL